MIKTKGDLIFYLEADRFALGRKNKKPAFYDKIWRFQICLRKLEYHSNNITSPLSKILKKFYQYKKFQLSYELGFDIPINVFGAGLRINHFGYIVIHPSTRVGMWCDIHQGVNIGVNNSVEDQMKAPVIGDNVWIGPGAKIFGNINIGDRVQIGANSVVNRGIPSDITIAGIPAKKIKDIGTDASNITANRKIAEQFFQNNPRYQKYKYNVE